jgi:hypothetical protein
MISEKFEVKIKKGMTHRTPITDGCTAGDAFNELAIPTTIGTLTLKPLFATILRTATDIFLRFQLDESGTRVFNKILGAELTRLELIA